MRQFDYLAQAEIAHQQRHAATHVARALLIREALAGDRVTFYQPLIVGFGKRLEKFGARLQARYSENHLQIGHSGTLASELAR